MPCSSPVHNATRTVRLNGSLSVRRILMASSITGDSSRVICRTDSAADQWNQGELRSGHYDLTRELRVGARNFCDNIKAPSVGRKSVVDFRLKDHRNAFLYRSIDASIVFWNEIETWWPSLRHHQMRSRAAAKLHHPVVAHAGGENPQNAFVEKKLIERGHANASRPSPRRCRTTSSVRDNRRGARRIEVLAQANVCTGSSHESRHHCLLPWRPEWSSSKTTRVYRSARSRVEWRADQDPFPSERAVIPRQVIFGVDLNDDSVAHEHAISAIHQHGVGYPTTGYASGDTT